MKRVVQSILDFRMAISHEIDIVLTARAKVGGTDKATIAREVLSRWAASEMQFGDFLKTETDRAEERIAHSARRKPLKRVEQNRVFKRDGFVCRQCGDSPGVEKLHIDHIIPVAAGGSNELSNLQVLCVDCNLAKSDKIVAIK